MTHTRQPQPVKILLGLLYPSVEWLERIEKAVEEHFGEIDCRTNSMPFTYTDYYSEEMGGELLRSWCTIKEPACPEFLADWKVFTNSLEDQWSEDGRRIVNIDPGYISLPKVVLASAKDFTQRIYLRDGIYAEITLFFKGKSFQTLPWTYPDYADLISTLNQWRRVLKGQIIKR